MKHNDIVKNLKTKWFLVAVASALLVGCGPTPSEDFGTKVAKAMETSLSDDLAAMTFTVKPLSLEPAPALVYEGKTAVVLATTAAKRVEYPFEPTMVMEGLARTKGGRYFEFYYNSRLLERQDSFLTPERLCMNEPGCRYFSHRKALSETEAKSWFFNSAGFSPERYKQIFHEEAPAKFLPA